MIRLMKWRTEIRKNTNHALTSTLFACEPVDLCVIRLCICHIRRRPLCHLLGPGNVALLSYLTPNISAAKVSCPASVGSWWLMG
jgi:hypothetical protein